ncbi:hypothetical protein EJ06DRAFT_521373 [Trichodelitschia bisporula]|uniref:Uncharacterized protein n=1 Tax=Trichodelitschia bisporula TaxID=703511 RepID=A0A6G1HX82_9PEZI|nr:hypothetical protein EJ06DRAFT_521373 [Trichodelitschia bisporula]
MAYLHDYPPMMLDSILRGTGSGTTRGRGRVRVNERVRRYGFLRNDDYETVPLAPPPTLRLMPARLAVAVGESPVRAAERSPATPRLQAARLAAAVVESPIRNSERSPGTLASYLAQWREPSYTDDEGFAEEHEEGRGEEGDEEVLEGRARGGRWFASPLGGIREEAGEGGPERLISEEEDGGVLGCEKDEEREEEEEGPEPVEVVQGVRREMRSGRTQCLRSRLASIGSNGNDRHGVAAAMKCQ